MMIYKLSDLTPHLSFHQRYSAISQQGDKDVETWYSDDFRFSSEAIEG
jgi:hypothetical protein